MHPKPCGPWKGFTRSSQFFTTLSNQDVAKLKICNVHYNKDHRRHHSLQKENTGMCITDYICMVCNKKVRATRSLPCHKTCHPSAEWWLSCVLCHVVFFSESKPHNGSIEQNEDFYHQCSLTSAPKISNYVCIKCRGPIPGYGKDAKGVRKVKKRDYIQFLEGLERVDTPYSSKESPKQSRQKMLAPHNCQTEKLLFCRKKKSTPQGS